MRALLLLPLLAMVASCSNNSGGGTAPSTPTLVAVDPQDFLGNVPCADAPGAMRSYVATIYDVTPGIGGDSGVTEFALPSSGPVSCTRQIAFGGGFVLQGHRYVADIQAYDRTDIKPFGSGSPIMVDAKTGAVVSPRWTTSCGRGGSSATTDAGADSGDAGGPEAGTGDAGNPDAGNTDAGNTDAGSTDAGSTNAGDAASSEAGTPLPVSTSHPVVAAQYKTVFVRGCAPLTAHEPAGATGVSVGIDDTMLSALGLACGSAAGQIDRYEVSIDGSTALPLQAPCDQRVTFYSLTPGTGYHFTLQAFEQGATQATWGTHCFETALDGTIIPAACDPLTDRGAIRLDSAALLAQLGLSCGGDLVSLDAELATTPAQSALQTPPECEAPIHFSGLAAGLYGIDVTTTLSTHPGPTASCVASVVPAGVTTAQCTPNP